MVTNSQYFSWRRAFEGAPEGAGGAPEGSPLGGTPEGGGGGGMPDTPEGMGKPEGGTPDGAGPEGNGSPLGTSEGGPAGAAATVCQVMSGYFGCRRGWDSTLTSANNEGGEDEVEKVHHLCVGTSG